MEEQWEEIEEFPWYSVSASGMVWDGLKERVITTSKNQQGIRYVTLRDPETRIQLKRQLSLLVAKAWLGDPPFEEYGSVIHLNGDRSDCRAENLAWRPRWFVVKYHRDVNDLDGLNSRPVQCIDTKEVFDNLYVCARSLGVIQFDIIKSSIEGTRVFPIWHTFRFL